MILYFINFFFQVSLLPPSPFSSLSTHMTESISPHTKRPATYAIDSPADRVRRSRAVRCPAPSTFKTVSSAVCVYLPSQKDGPVCINEPVRVGQIVRFHIRDAGEFTHQICAQTQGERAASSLRVTSLTLKSRIQIVFALLKEVSVIGMKFCTSE